MKDKRKIVGIPCVGGKTKLADILCSIIEEYCERTGIRKVYDICGGGGKLSCSLDRSKFSFIGYNEWEYGLATLMRSLQYKGNVVRISNRVQYIIDKVINSDIDADEETKCRVLFDVARKYVSCGPDDHPDLDIVVAATLATIIIWGSVQNNRTTIHYSVKNNAGDIENSFIKILVKNMSYLDNFIKVNMSVRDMHCTNADCFELLKKYHDDSDMFLVIDPPYFDCTNGYKNDWSYSMHKELIRLCKDAKCSVMICMHEEGIKPYLTLFDAPGWHCFLADRIIHSSKKSEADKIKDLSETAPANADNWFITQLLKTTANVYLTNLERGYDADKEEKKANEYIWCNFQLESLKEFKSAEEVFHAPTKLSYDKAYKIPFDSAAEFDAYYEEKEKNAFCDTEPKSKEYKFQAIFDRIVELLDLPKL